MNHASAVSLFRLVVSRWSRPLHTAVCRCGVNQKQISVRSDDDARPRRALTVDWHTLKRSWKYFVLALRRPFTRAEHMDGINRQWKQDEVVYYFRSEHDLDHWYVNTDEDVGGHSWAEFRLGANEMTAVFRGRLSNKAPRERMRSADPLHTELSFRGFTYLETLPFQTVLDKEEFMSWVGFNMVKLRLRGDGRRYHFESLCDFGMNQRCMFTAPVYTNGGPLWQEVTIPFAKLMQKHRSRLSTLQSGLDVNKMMNFRFLLDDGIEGPFRLEIDYIALARDLAHDIPGRSNTDYYDPWSNINKLSF